MRAKRTLAEKQVPFEVPRGAELAERLASVLEVIYLIFNEGYSATAGDDWMRPQLCEEALRLGRILAGLAPERARGARPRRPDGDPGLAPQGADQALGRADPAARPEPRALGPAADPPRPCRARLRPRRRPRALASALGPYALQAAIAACHARARTAEDTDWARIVGLYGALSEITPSPVVELNRAVALAMLFGPAAGLEVVDALTDEPALKAYHLLPSVRGDLLHKLGRLDEARAEFERAASLTRNERERNLLLARAAACTSPPIG